MVDTDTQGKGMGSSIIDDLISYIKLNGYSTAILSYVEGNIQSRDFWKKNLFVETDEIDDYGDIRMVTMERLL